MPPAWPIAADHSLLHLEALRREPSGTSSGSGTRSTWRHVPAKGIDVVRRRTGGGAVYHDEHGEITYSLIAPEGLFSKDIRASYRDICGCIIEGLASLGIAAEFRPINDVTVNGRKISGSAQTRRQGILTQHGTVLYAIDRDTMFSVLRPSAKKLADKPVRLI